MNYLNKYNVLEENFNLENFIIDIHSRLFITGFLVLKIMSEETNKFHNGNILLCHSFTSKRTIFFLITRLVESLYVGRALKIGVYVLYFLGQFFNQFMLILRQG